MSKADEIDSYMLNLDDSSSEEDDFPDLNDTLPPYDPPTQSSIAEKIAEKWVEFVNDGHVDRLFLVLQKAKNLPGQTIFCEQLRVCFILHQIGTSLLFRKEPSEQYAKLKKRHLYQSDIRHHDELMRNWISTSLAEVLKQFTLEGEDELQKRSYSEFQFIAAISNKILTKKRRFFRWFRNSDPNIFREDTVELLKTSSYSTSSSEISILNTTVPPKKEFSKKVPSTPSNKKIHSRMLEVSESFSTKDGSQNKSKKAPTWRDVFNDKQHIAEYSQEQLQELKAKACKGNELSADADLDDYLDYDESIFNLPDSILELLLPDNANNRLETLFLYFFKMQLMLNLSMLKIERKTLPSDFKPRVSSYTEVFAQLRLTQRSISRQTRNILGEKAERIRAIDDGDIEEMVTFDWRYPSGTVYEKAVIRRAVDETSGKLSTDRIVETLHSYKSKKTESAPKPPITGMVEKLKIKPESLSTVFNGETNEKDFATKLHHLLIVVEGLRNTSIFILNPMLIELMIAEDDIGWKQALASASTFGNYFSEGLMPTAPSSSKEYSFWLQQQFLPYLIHEFSLPSSGNSFSPTGVHDLIQRESKLFQLWLNRKHKASVPTQFFDTATLADIMKRFVDDFYFPELPIRVSPILSRKSTETEEDTFDEKEKRTHETLYIDIDKTTYVLETIPNAELQTGWNCGDIAFSLSNGENPEQDRADFVKWAIQNCDQHKFHHIIFTEIMSAAMISYAEQLERFEALEGRKACLDLLDILSDKKLKPVVQEALQKHNRVLSKSSVGLPEVMIQNPELLNIMQELVEANLIKNNEKTDTALKKLGHYCMRKEVFEVYMREHYGKQGWIVFQPMQQFKSIIDVIALYTQSKIVIVQNNKIIYESIDKNNGAPFPNTIFGHYNGHNHFVSLNIICTIKDTEEPIKTPHQQSQPSPEAPLLLTYK